MYISSIFRRGKRIFCSQPFPTRKEAVQNAFDENPAVTRCTTALATKINNEWRDANLQIEEHSSYEGKL